MLLRGDPGEDWQYRCLLISLTHEGLPVRDLMVQPSAVRVKGSRGYRFFFGGFLWAFFITSHDYPRPPTRAHITRDGKLLVVIRDISRADFIADFGRLAINQGKI
jgi:hypothetical protein